MALSLAACSGKTDADQSILNEAATFHNEAINVQEQVEPLIDEIDSVRTVLIKKMTPEAKITAQSLDSLKTAFEQWEENLVEVPGMKHEHHHEHDKGHHHHHNSDTKDLPADQMRDLQQAFLTNIKQIQQQTQQAMEQAKSIQ
ncbi:hypothetical protein GJR95_39475 [Spirosoma endbachense]|uniref:Uncharacterized protein n=1 Tax=Spirosoma endbachense TaxID=2666025 RepID=A0A6P1WCB3_9BACT|nr:hypothetical protein GJR95_39475 [Spirosoma endbachense]